MTLFPHYFSEEVVPSAVRRTHRPPRPDMYRDVLRMFHPADGENSGASLGRSVLRNGIIAQFGLLLALSICKEHFGTFPHLWSFTERKNVLNVKYREQEIIHALLANDFIQQEFRPKWKSLERSEADGRLTMYLNGKAQTFLVDVKSDVRPHMLSRLQEQMKAHGDALLVAARLSDTAREHLRERGLNYLEVNGNCNIRTDAAYVAITGRPPLAEERTKRQRAFSKAGLRVIFTLLIDKKAIDGTLALLAGRSGTSIANVSNTLQGLLHAGLLLEQGKRKLIIPDRTVLLHKWTDAYTEKLKPGLARGRYRFAKRELADDWRNLDLDFMKTCWGGEAAGALLTKYLKPGTLTLFTSEARPGLIKNYTLVPDENGNVLVYERFWDQPEANALGGRCCPPILAYADLIHSRDSRCVETAQRLFDEHIGPAL